MRKSVKWPPSIRLKVFKQEGSLLEAKNQHSSLLCWCKSSSPSERSLGFSSAAHESDVVRPLLSSTADPSPPLLSGTHDRMIRQPQQHVIPISAHQQTVPHKDRGQRLWARAANSNFRSSALLWGTSKTTKSKLQQSCTPERVLLFVFSTLHQDWH